MSLHGGAPRGAPSTHWRPALSRAKRAIQRRGAEAKDKYHHTVEPIQVFERDGKTIVVGKVSGDFPNSPLDLEPVFDLDGGKIASLEVR